MTLTSVSRKRRSRRPLSRAPLEKARLRSLHLVARDNDVAVTVALDDGPFLSLLPVGSGIDGMECSHVGASVRASASLDDDRDLTRVTVRVAAVDLDALRVGPEVVSLISTLGQPQNGHG